MNFLKVAIISILISTIWSCSNSEASTLNTLQEDSFLNSISINDMNNSLHIEVTYDDYNEYKLGSAVDVLVNNVSNQEIFLPTDSSVLKTFVAKNNNWVEVKNNVTYFGNGSILYPKGNIGTEWLTAVRPVLEASLGNIEDQVSVRILVVGEFMSNGKKTGEPVAAYVDLVMKP